MAKAEWAKDWKVGVRVWIERGGQAVLGEGRAELLAAIETEHSITKAAKAAGMSYRRAWNLIQEVNTAAGEALVEAAVGGKQGGGARLTDRGRLAIRVYNDVRGSLVASAAGALERAARPNANDMGCIHLAAAISLQEAVGQVIAEYALVNPAVRVRAIFGASNELADQILAGAPGEVFISADGDVLDRLEVAELVAKSSRRVIAKNGLAIVGAAKAKQIGKASELLGSKFKRIAVAEPECPLGRYSQAYLEKQRLYEELRPKMLFVDNSRAVLSAVASGAAQAGIAFSSDASGHGSWERLYSVPSSQAVTTYESALIGRHEPSDGTQLLCDFLSSTAAARCYRRCGLRPV